VEGQRKLNVEKLTTKFEPKTMPLDKAKQTRASRESFRFPDVLSFQVSQVEFKCRLAFAISNAIMMKMDATSSLKQSQSQSPSNRALLYLEIQRSDLGQHVHPQASNTPQVAILRHESPPSMSSGAMNPGEPSGIPPCSFQVQQPKSIRLDLNSA